MTAEYLRIMTMTVSESFYFGGKADCHVIFSVVMFFSWRLVFSTDALFFLMFFRENSCF